jgi:hypothetical protein
MVVFALAAGGCGGAGEVTHADSSATSSAKPAATVSQPAASAGQLARAAAICTRRNRELVAATRPGASLNEILATAPRRAAIERKALTELERISPPAKIAQEWKTILAATEGSLNTTEDLAKDVPSNDLASLRRQIASVNKPQLRLLLTATRAGIKQCASVAEPSVQVPLQAR